MTEEKQNENLASSTFTSPSITSNISEQIDYKVMYKSSPINFVNKNTSPSFLYCDRCKKTTPVKKVGKFPKSVINKFRKRKPVCDENRLFRCKECNEYYKIKLYRPVDHESSNIKEKSIILGKKIAVMGSKAKDSCTKIYSSLKSKSSKFLSNFTNRFNKQ